MSRVFGRNEKTGQETFKQPDANLNILEQLPGMIWRSGLDEKRYYVNKSWIEFTGRTLKQELGDGWVQGIHPDDVDRCMRMYHQAFQEQQPFIIEYRLRDHNGAYCWILDSGRPMINEQGHCSGYVGICYDISERKHMEKALLETNQALESANVALRQSEAMFKSLFEFAPDAVVAVNQEGTILLVNSQAQAMFGYSRDEMIGQPIDLLMPDSFLDRHHAHVAKFISNPRRRAMGAGLALVAQRKDGTSFPVDINLGPLETDNTLVVLATIRDTTETKQAEEALRESEKLLTTAATSAPIVFFRVDRAGIVQFSLGQSLIERLENVQSKGKSVYELYQKMPGVIESFQRALAGETITTVIEADGFVYEATYAPLQNETGEITGVVGVASDVTRHRQVEQALRESEAHFRTIFNDTILGIYLVDLSGKIVESNPALQSMLGCTAADLQNKYFVDVLHPEDIPLVQRLFDQMVEGKLEQFQVELRYIHHSGQVLWTRLAMSLFRSQDGRPLYGIGMAENTTEQKKIESELAELQRRLIDSAEFERLQLAQDLHDGPLQDLQAISLQISALNLEIDANHGSNETAELQQLMSSVISSIRSITGELRPPALAPFGLEKAIRSHAQHFREQHPEIQLSLNLEEDGQALSERVRLVLFRVYQHSMANILRHSRATEVKVDFHLNEEQIELRIADNGEGFKVPRRWIELVRQGHYGLVGAIERTESVGGHFEIQSNPGEGTVIHVRVPRREEDQIATRERLSAARPASQP